MQSITKRDTRPEIAVRRLLHSYGYRFRLHRRDLPGTPDVVLPKHKTAVFVHGCFWHQHSCELAKEPKSNQTYWLPKLARNQERDSEARKQLQQLGWHVVVVWECETRNAARLRRKLIGYLQGVAASG